MRFFFFCFTPQTSEPRILIYRKHRFFDTNYHIVRAWRSVSQITLVQTPTIAWTCVTFSFRWSSRFARGFSSKRETACSVAYAQAWQNAMKEVRTDFGLIWDVRCRMCVRRGKSHIKRTEMNEGWKSDLVSSKSVHPSQWELSPYLSGNWAAKKKLSWLRVE